MVVDSTLVLQTMIAVHTMSQSSRIACAAATSPVEIRTGD